MKEQELTELLDHLPVSPGVYLMKDLKGKIVYVGKAKNLKSRVRQYFHAATSDTRYFVKNLRQKLSTIETVITSTEKEAILLEYNLIQKHTPRYNIRLTDDKSFLCLKLNLDAEWPKLELVRRPQKKDKALYFGPYPSATGARQTLKLVNRHFKLRSCRDSNFKNRVRPCLQHQIKRCLAPCTLPVDRSEYNQQIQFVRLFLDGKKEDLIRQLQKQMEEAAQHMAYEVAATLRDQIAAIEDTISPQRITEISNEDRDIFGLYREGDRVTIVIMQIVKGRLEGRRDFFFKGQEFPDEELLSSFIIQQYRQSYEIPDEILVPASLEDMDALTEVLCDKREKKMRIHHPKRGKRVEQLKMAHANAIEVFTLRTRQEQDMESRLQAIQHTLHLPRFPRRIECIDIAHFAGTNTVAAISAVVNGKIDAKTQRVYNVKSDTGGDDYLAMHEVLTRRFTRAVKQESGWEAPDLLVIDGGKGQLNIALAVLEELGVHDQPVVALAKERQGVDSAETDRAFLPNRINPVAVRAQTSALFILSMARDEAHRLANGFQEKSRRKKTLVSALDTIPNVGPKTRQALLRHFGSVKRIRESTADQLTQVKGVSLTLAQTILNALQQ
ncbi:MAG: excinuclease ABC subunit UvrC [Deltaproteobacteria bacterium]|nr:excinuclease ABC subunit UvrC [Deltaproteobacteria bacterium]MBN2670378.1 excinuclease ABC subunit UvrC [Deltaproteobacteria bacterium]